MQSTLHSVIWSSSTLCAMIDIIKCQDVRFELDGWTTVARSTVCEREEMNKRKRLLLHALRSLSTPLSDMASHYGHNGSQTHTLLEVTIFLRLLISYPISSLCLLAFRRHTSLDSWRQSRRFFKSLLRLNEIRSSKYIQPRQPADLLSLRLALGPDELC